jgi:hypothetical protein
MAAANPGSQSSPSASEHPAPNASEEHRFWRTEFRQSNSDEETLRNIFWLVNASDHLQGIGKIAVNLTAILRLIFDNPAVEDSDLATFRGWPRVLESLARSNTISATANPNGNECYVRSPLWALLWEDIKDPTVLKHYRILQGHLLWAHAKYLSNESSRDSELGKDAYERYDGTSTWPVFPDPPYEAALRIRNLAHAEWTDTLMRIEADLSGETETEMK